MTRVLVAAASAVVRAGLESIVRERAGFEVAGTVASMMDVAPTLAAMQPDVVLVDLERTRDGAAPGPLTFASESGLPHVVALVDAPQDVEVADLLRAGAGAVLSRDASAEAITAAIESVAAGLITLYEGAAAALVALLPPPSRSLVDGFVEPLTPREIEVLELMAEGEANKAIARRLAISEHTVKFHVGSILAKLHASSRTEAVTLGVRQGVIMI